MQNPSDSPIHPSKPFRQTQIPDLQSLRYLIPKLLASNVSQVERVTNVSSCDTYSTVPKKVSVLADSLKLMWGQPVR